MHWLLLSPRQHPLRPQRLSVSPSSANLSMRILASVAKYHRSGGCELENHASCFVRLVHRKSSSVWGVLDAEIIIKESQPRWSKEQVLSTHDTAQNAKYGFKVSQDLRSVEHNRLWRIEDQVIRPKKPESRWLQEPIPVESPVESTLMRGLSLDPRLCVSQTYAPLETIFQQLQAQGVVEHITSRDSEELGRIVVVKWTSTGSVLRGRP
jgi:hypothetical protein